MAIQRLREPRRAHAALVMLIGGHRHEREREAEQQQDLLLDNTQALADLIGREHLSEAVLRLLDEGKLSAGHARALITAEVAEAVARLGHPLAKASFGSRVAYAACIGEGSTVLETAPGGPAAEEVKAVAREVAKHAAG